MTDESVHPEEEADEVHQALSAPPVVVASLAAHHRDSLAEMDSAEKTDALLSVFHERAISEVM